jgi:pimeloyl-ACP methyl ester carboxylesterase
MKHALAMLCGVLCEESFWGDIPQRLSDIADVSVVSFRGLNSIRAMALQVLNRAPEQFTVAGHSMGGRVALEIMVIAPQRVTGLALLNTGVHAVRDGEPQARQQLLRLAYQRGMSALAAEWLPPLLGSDALRRAEVLPRLQAMAERFSVDEYAGQVKAMLHRPDALSVLPTVTVPTLLLSGSDDTSSPVSAQESIRRRITHATLFEIHAAGHMAPLERPEPVSLALREWLLKC